MKLLTLTPDVHVYVVAVLAVYSLSCAPLTTYLQISWPTRGHPEFLPLYAAMMGIVATLGLVTFDVPTVTERSVSRLALSIPVGLGAGIMAIWSDATVRRLVQRRARRTRGSSSRRPGRNPGSGNVRFPAASGPSRPTASPGFALDPYGRGTPSFSLLALLVAVATLEELLFRGVLVDLVLSLDNPAFVATCLAATLAAFSLSHIYWGWAEVMAKLPLGVLALVAVLGFRTVVPAVLSHVMFNVWTWRSAREAARERSHRDR